MTSELDALKQAFAQNEARLIAATKASSDAKSDLEEAQQRQFRASRSITANHSRAGEYAWELAQEEKTNSDMKLLHAKMSVENEQQLATKDVKSTRRSRKTKSWKEIYLISWHRRKSSSREFCEA